MNNLYKIIDKQIRFNEGLNLFCEDDRIFKFDKDFVKIARKVSNMNGSIIDSLINYAADKVFGEFYRINQYYNFDEQSKKDLKAIYINLLNDLKNDSISTNALSVKHQQDLKYWLKSHNPFAEKIYSPKDVSAKPVPCFEYDPEMQINLLQINISSIIEPVLDIGCGQQRNMVNYLRKKGIETFGFDRYPSNDSYIENADWLEYDYGMMKWGTIISNLGFSNHFQHHHLRQDGNYLEYARKYMQILHSLKMGGSFHYAPALPFIEKYLDNKFYSIKYKELKAQDVKSVTIKRLI